MSPELELSVLDVLPDLPEAIDSGVLPDLRRLLAAGVTHVEPGAWDPGPASRLPDAFAVVVLDGTLLRESALQGRRCTELLGPGDVVTPWADAGALLDVTVCWRAVSRLTLAVLDRTFLAATSRWPGLAASVAGLHGETCTRLATHKAICQLPRVEERLSLMLWLAAERFGRVAPDGIVVPLALTHEQLGHLIGARRPTVSLALGELVRRGAIERRADGAFVLHGRRPPSLPRAEARRRRAPALPPVAPAPSRSNRRAEFYTLRARVYRLGAQHRVSAERASSELERSKAARARSAELRRRARDGRRDSVVPPAHELPVL